MRDDQVRRIAVRRNRVLSQFVQERGVEDIELLLQSQDQHLFDSLAECVTNPN